MSFEVEIVSLGKHHIMLGVAADTLRNSTSCYQDADALTLYLFSTATYLYC